MKSILNGIISFFNLFLSSITGNPNTIRSTNTNTNNNTNNSRGGNNGNKLGHKGLGGGGKKKNQGRNIRGMKNLGAPNCGPKGGGEISIDCDCDWMDTD